MRKVLLPMEKRASVLHTRVTAFSTSSCVVTCSLQNNPGFALRRVQRFLVTKAAWDCMELLKAAVEEYGTHKTIKATLANMVNSK